MSPTVENTIQLLQRHGIGGSVETAIVLAGSGGSPAEGMTDVASVPYSELPGFPGSAAGGRLVVGTFEGARLAILEGRANYHTTGDAGAMRLALGTVARMGARIAIVQAAWPSSAITSTFPAAIRSSA